MDLLLRQSTLQINEKWLDFRASHDEVPCWLSRLSSVEKINTNMFSCDHVVAELFDLVLMEITKDKTGDNAASGEKDSTLRIRVNESLRQMPRMVESTHGDEPGEINVTWTDPESILASKIHGVDLKCRVTLHREQTCADKRNELVGPTGMGDVLMTFSLKSCTH